MKYPEYSYCSQAHRKKHVPSLKPATTAVLQFYGRFQDASTGKEIIQIYVIHQRYNEINGEHRIQLSSAIP